MKSTMRWVLILLWLPLSSQAFEEGFEYQTIVPPVPTNAGDQVEVVELFFYGCPHCFRAEPIIDEWLDKQPDFVDFKRMPAIFRDSWEPLARAFYTAEALGAMDRIHRPLFNALHIKRQKVFTKDALRSFFIAHGVSAADFDKTYDSFHVTTQVNRARDLTKRYKITGVPSFIVNGKFRSNGTMAGGLHNVPEVLDFLIRREVAQQTAAGTE